MQWRFYLIDRNGKKTLVDEPAGWERLTFKLKRHPQRHGTFREVQNINVEFRGKGGQLLKREYDQYGIRGKYEVLIQALCGQRWDEWYRGDVSFANYAWVSGEVCAASVDLDQKGALVKFLNRFDQQVEVGKLTSFDGVALTDYKNLSRQVMLPGKTIQLTNNVEVKDQLVSPDFTDNLDWQQNEIAGDEDIMNAYVIPGYNNSISQDIPGTSVYDTINFLLGGANNIPVPGSVPFIEFKELGSISCISSSFEFSFRMKGSILSSQGGSVAGRTLGRLKLFRLPVGMAPDVGNFIQEYSQTLFDIPSEGSATFDYADTLNLTIDIGDKLWWGIYVRGNPYRVDSWVLTMDDECFLKTVMNSICEPTNAKLYLINETISRVIEAITDNELKLYSEYFGRTNSQPYSFPANGCGSLRALTTGMDIRAVKQKDGSDPAMFLSMKDLFDDLSALDNIGMGMDGDNLVRIENWKHFYKPDVIHSCTGVDNIAYQIKSDEIYSILKIGYDKWEAEEYNGLDEFLTQREFRTSLSQIQNTLEKICRLISSGYAIEVTRRKYNNSKDWRYDQEKFIICLKEGDPITCDIVFSPTTGFMISPIENTSALFSLKPGDTFSLGGTLSNNGTFTVGSIEPYNMAVYVNTIEPTVNETATGAVFTPINNPFYQVNTGNISSPQYIVDPPTIYNFEISPIRMALKWFDKAMASFKGINTADKLIFSSGEANYKAEGELISSCRLENGLLKENQDISIADFTDAGDALPINETERAIYKHPLTTWEYKKILRSPDGLIYYSDGKSSGYGWIDELSYSPNEGIATFTLIPKSSNNA